MNENNVEAHEILSREMHKASVIDRNSIHEEIHGVRCMAVPETSESVSMALNAFENELTRAIPDHSPLKKIYNLILSNRTRARGELAKLNIAADYDPLAADPLAKVPISNRKNSKMRRILRNLNYCRNHYAIDRKAFRLRFLRCELFDIQKAVVRYCNYLNFAHELWGDIVLEREYRLSDFKRNEGKIFRKGYFQLLPFRDRSGRRIVTILGGMGGDVDPVARAKSIFYLWDVATRDSVESQRMGSILVMEGYCWEDGIDGSFQFPKEDLRLMKQIVSSIPSRVVAIHNSWPDAPVFRFLAKIIAIHGVVGSMQRLRMKFQVGDEMEMRYNLKAYGIPIHLVARSETGTIKWTHHVAWMRTRKLIEDSGYGDNSDETSPSPLSVKNNEIVVECPLTNDVIFRQGNPYWENPGNSAFRDLIHAYCDSKTTITDDTKNESLEEENAFLEMSSSIHNIDLSDNLDENLVDTEAIIFSPSDDKSNVNSNDKTRRVESERHIEFRDFLIEDVCNRRGGRFLEWAKNLKSFVVMWDKNKIEKKVSVSIYNCRRKASSATSVTSTATTVRIRKVNPYDGASNSTTDDGGDKAYQFINSDPSVLEDCCLVIGSANATPATPPTKRQRTDRSFDHSCV